MSEVTLTFPTKEYIDDLICISKLSFPISWSRDSFIKEIDNSFAKYVIALVDNKAVGYGGMWLILDEAHITNIAVHPDYRGHGIGDKILHKLIEICIENEINSMTLEVRASNVIAQNLYNKYGFIEEGIRKKYYEDNKEDAIIMWKHNISSKTERNCHVSK